MTKKLEIKIKTAECRKAGDRRAVSVEGRGHTSSLFGRGSSGIADDNEGRISTELLWQP